MKSIWVKDEITFEDLKEKCWSGAIDTLEAIEKAEKQGLFMEILEDMSIDNIWTLTEINDFLWFQPEDIYDMLEIETDEDGNPLIESEVVQND